MSESKFSGFKSRCAMLLSWQYLTASNISQTNFVFGQIIRRLRRGPMNGKIALFIVVALWVVVLIIVFEC